MSDPQNPWHRILQLRGTIRGVFDRQKQKLKEQNKNYRRKVRKILQKGKR